MGDFNRFHRYQYTKAIVSFLENLIFEGFPSRVDCIGSASIFRRALYRSEIRHIPIYALEDFLEKEPNMQPLSNGREMPKESILAIKI
ncbi:MAG: hypothetical protein AAGE99_02400 [Chlamydiota bacterium]